MVSYVAIQILLKYICEDKDKWKYASMYYYILHSVLIWNCAVKCNIKPSVKLKQFSILWINKLFCYTIPYLFNIPSFN